MCTFFKPCMDAFKASLEEIKPSSCVQKSLLLRQNNQLIVNGRTYRLSKNVHLVAVGKAAPGMVEGAEQVLGQHFAGGIASIPDGTRIPANLRTQFMVGAEDNLPDERALENAQKIEQFIRAINRMQGEQLILFLISGGGSALLPSPIPDVTLADKVRLIQLLQRNGADIRQLNIVRTALSRLKGGGLARIGHPSKMISLIISDIVGDPIDLISSGPTVIQNEQRDPIGILNELGVTNNVDRRIIEAIEAEATRRRQEQTPAAEMAVDVQNVIVASNAKMLATFANQLAAHGFVPAIVTNRLEGDATALGRAMARLAMELAKRGAVENWNEERLQRLLLEQKLVPAEERPGLEELAAHRGPMVLLFGGESTVKFDPERVEEGAKGGRNQELVLAAFEHLLGQTERERREQERMGKFIIFSLGTDGQDGPTDAAGAYISSDDVPPAKADFTSLRTKVHAHLEGKNSYHFWADEFNDGRNLIKLGKTGMNVMDVQIIVFTQ